MLSKDKFSIIADAIRPGLSNPARADEAAHSVVGALMAAGYAITRGRPTGPALVERGPSPRPLMTNAVAGGGRRRGVFST